MATPELCWKITGDFKKILEIHWRRQKITGNNKGNCCRYFAGKKIGWSYLSEKDSKETFEAFKRVFNSLKRQSKDGINFEIKNNKEETYTKSFDKKLFEKLRKKYKV